MYVGGNAGIHQTFRANRRAYEKFGIIPRMLVDSTVRDLSVGVGFQIPVSFF
jgi:lactate 2-monooxygenase